MPAPLAQLHIPLETEAGALSAPSLRGAESPGRGSCPGRPETGSESPLESSERGGQTGGRPSREPGAGLGLAFLGEGVAPPPPGARPRADSRPPAPGQPVARCPGRGPGRQAGSATCWLRAGPQPRGRAACGAVGARATRTHGAGRPFACGAPRKAGLQFASPERAGSAPRLPPPRAASNPMPGALLTEPVGARTGKAGFPGEIGSPGPDPAPLRTGPLGAASPGPRGRIVLGEDEGRAC